MSTRLYLTIPASRCMPTTGPTKKPTARSTRSARRVMPVYRFTAPHLTDEVLRFGNGCEFSSCPL
jgi:hypothetical protein